MPYGFNEDKSKYVLSQKNITASTLLSSGWNNKVYSFENQYPSNKYDVEIELDGDYATEDHIDAWNGAKLLGSSSRNIIKASGDVPTINIPIILKVVTKWVQV